MRLLTFGGLSLQPGPDDPPAAALGPRPLALLALVAAAGPRGITREKILGILWSETGEERARHTLSQTLYSIRRAGGAGWVNGSAQLKLDGSLTSDVRDFFDALQQEDMPRAAEIHSGEFLEGFYLPDSPEFERWVEDTRARLHVAARTALETLARRANEVGSHADTLEWATRLTRLEPLNAQLAAARIRAHITSADRAGALKFAREYESRVRRELEIEPDSQIAALIARLRTPAHSPLEIIPDSRQDAALIPQEAAHSGEASTRHAFAADVNVTPSSSATRRIPRRRATFIAIGALAFAAVAWNASPLRLRGADLPSSPLLAVGTITARDSAQFGAILRDMLATNLARVHGMHVVANSRLVELLAHNYDSEAGSTTDAAARAGAKEIIEGEIAPVPDGLALTLRRVSIATGVVAQGYTVRAKDLFALADSATVVLARDFHLDPPTDAVATVRTRSAVAYALYEQGLRELYHGEAASALTLMNAALERDSSFAMAAAQAWRLSIIVERAKEAERLLPLVRRLAPLTIERERMWIETIVTHYTGEPLNVTLQAARVFRERYPNDPESHVFYGIALANSGDTPQAIVEYNIAVAIDSAALAPVGTFCRLCFALGSMRDGYMWSDSLVAAERAAQRLVKLRSQSGLSHGALIEPLLRQGRRGEAEKVIDKMRAAKPGVPMDFSTLLDRDLIRWGRLDEVEAKLTGALSSAAPGAYGEMPWLLQFTLRNQGRLREAGELAREGKLPSSAVRLKDYGDPLTVAIVAMQTGSPADAARHFMESTAAMRTQRTSIAAGSWARHMSFRMTLAAGAYIAAGDTATARALADSVERIGQQSSWARDYRLHHFVRGLLLQRKKQHEEAVAEFRKAVFSLTDGYTRINVEMANSLMALGRHNEAIAVLQPALRGGVDGGNTYATHAELHSLLADAFYSAGRIDSATHHYRAVERAWRNADPQFHARYDVALERSGGRRPQ